MGLNRTSMSKVMVVWIGPEILCSILSVSIKYVPQSDIRVKIYDHLKFSRTSVFQFREFWYIMGHNRTPMSKVMVEFRRPELRCSILSVLINYVPKLDIRVKSYDHLNFSRASVVQFRACRWVMSPNRTSVWKVMTIRFYRDLPLFNFERLDILWPRIGHLCENVWPFEFLESFRCSISSV